MKITADTNILLRALLGDDREQCEAAIDVLDRAEVVAISLQSFCELAWVLTRSYATSRADVASAIRDLVETGNVAVDRAGVEAGLAALQDGGDFADGVIAYEGRRLGGDLFVSFDKKAVRAMKALGFSARVLG